MLSMGVHTTRQRQTSNRLVQVLNACDVGHIATKSVASSREEFPFSYFQIASHHDPRTWRTIVDVCSEAADAVGLGMAITNHYAHTRQTEGRKELGFTSLSTALGHIATR